MYDDYDVCYECSGYGDDYFVNDEGELECYCPQCPHSRNWDDDYDDWNKGLKGENMVEVKMVERRNGCDCWGRAEYDYVYVVTDENGNKIYESETDPTKLINFLTNDN